MTPLSHIHLRSSIMQTTKLELVASCLSLQSTETSTPPQPPEQTTKALSLSCDLPNSARPNPQADWETCVAVPDFYWKQIAEPVMRLYTETTDGSTIEAKESALDSLSSARFKKREKIKESGEALVQWKEPL